MLVVVLLVLMFDDDALCDASFSLIDVVSDATTAVVEEDCHVVWVDVLTVLASAWNC